MAPDHVYREKRTIFYTHHTRDKETGVRSSSTRTALIEVEIDIDGIFENLGGKAARSVGGKSIMGGGMVKARRMKLPVWKK